MTVTRVPDGFERHSWDHVWMNVAHAVAKRSGCVKAQCGAVIAREDNRVVSVGYNGPPTLYQGTCQTSCPRAREGHTDSGYDSCISIHAEANAIMHCDRDSRQGGTIYVTATICVNCAKLIANSGIRRVVMRVNRGEAHRQPERTVAVLQAAGIIVDVWGVALPTYRTAFFTAYGSGPFPCHFCGEILGWVEVVHHIDGDHENDDPRNLRPAHQACHSSHHNKGKTLSSETKDKLRKPRSPQYETCSCGHRTTHGRMKKHREETGHVA